MINLLPPYERKNVEKEYKFRLASTYILLTSIAVFIGLILLLPSYFLVNVKADIVSQELNKLQSSSESAEREEINEKLRGAKEKLAVLTLEKESVTLFAIVDSVSTHTKGSVDINSILYTRAKDDGTSTFVVGGVASTRDALITFKKLLDGEDLFEEVVLPVSSLAKESDIDFSIQLKGNF